MPEESEVKTNKSSLVTKLAGFVLVLGSLSAGLNYIEEISETWTDLVSKFSNSERCYSVKMLPKEEIPYSQIEGLGPFTIDATNSCSYPIWIRVEFHSLTGAVQINPGQAANPKSWQVIKIEAQKGLNSAIQLPNLRFLNEKRDFNLEVNWYIFQKDPIHSEKEIDSDSVTIKIVDDGSLALRKEE